jgi:hypothetical protein
MCACNNPRHGTIAADGGQQVNLAKKKATPEMKCVKQL